MKKSKLLLVVVGLALATSSAGATIHPVTIGDNFFSPLHTTVQVGDTVRWTWEGVFPHSSISDDVLWDSGITSEFGFTFEVVFEGALGPGDYPYHCAVHALTMKDTITVLGAPGCCVDDMGSIRLDDGGTDCGDLSDQTVDVADLTNLIDHLFINFTPICCADEGDFAPLMYGDPQDAAIDVADLTGLIDHLFINFTLLPACP